MINRTLLATLLIALLASTSGCAWLRGRPTLEPTPVLFHELPTLEQLTVAVNSNTDRVHTLQGREGKLVLKGLPDISLDLAYEQPRRLRLRAGTGLLGQELDLGNNDDLFWFWAKRSPEPALFFARHDRFAQSPNRAMLPIEPSWVIDAIGLPRFELQHFHEGPVARGGGVLEIRTRLPTALGESTKITHVHAKYGWVLQQTIYDPHGRLIASATATDHEFYPYAQVALPRKVAIELPAAQLSFAVETGGYALNVPIDNPAVFALPEDQFPGATLVDIAEAK
jgi:hypothetical protein